MAKSKKSGTDACVTAKDEKIAELEEKLRALEHVRGDQVAELLERQQTLLSDIAKLLVRNAGTQARCDNFGH